MTQSSGSGGGYQVDTSQLTSFSKYLSGTTAKSVTQAGNDVQNANGFDNNAFGILMAQFWSAPVRIDMAIIHSKIMGDLTDSINDVVDALQRNVDSYGQQESDTVDSFQKIQSGLNSAGNADS
ncbi:MAG TPA: hypothetical protein VF444_00515 [Pseudonocardiaceae bacterium]